MVTKLTYLPLFKNLTLCLGFPRPMGGTAVPWVSGDTGRKELMGLCLGNSLTQETDCGNHPPFRGHPLPHPPTELSLPEAPSMSQRLSGFGKADQTQLIDFVFQL